MQSAHEHSVEDKTSNTVHEQAHQRDQNSPSDLNLQDEDPSLKKEQKEQKVDLESFKKSKFNRGKRTLRSSGTMEKQSTRASSLPDQYAIPRDD